MSEPGAIKRMPRPGTIVPFGGDSVPDGWLLCNGAAVSRTAYARLYSAIGTAWGAGDGSTTFNLPDGRGKVLQGADSTNSLGDSVGASLPNIYGRWGERRATDSGGGSYPNIQGVSGCFSITLQDESFTTERSTLLEYVPDYRDLIACDASSYNSIYGSSAIVQPPALATQYMIRC